MFAIAFGLDYLTTAATHPKSVRQAYCASVKDIRAFRVENWSNFNAFFKGPNL